MARLLEALVFAATVGVVAFAFTDQAHAMHCDGRIVDVGDSTQRVRSLCGEPTQLSSRVESRSIAIHRRAPGGIVVADAITVSVLVETWLYDFGPARFQRSLTFEDGRLRAIETLGYGNVRSAAGFGTGVFAGSETGAEQSDIDRRSASTARDAMGVCPRSRGLG